MWGVRQGMKGYGYEWVLGSMAHGMDGVGILSKQYK